MTRINFLQVTADKRKNLFVNQEYLPEILSLFDKNKNILPDEFKQNDFYSTMLEYINILSPYFMAVTYDDKFAGVIYLDKWHIVNGKPHSCRLNAYIDRKYWGKPVIEGLNQILKLLFNELKIERIDLEIPEYNKMAISFANRTGFKHEGKRLNAIRYRNKNSNLLMFGMTRYYYKNKRVNNGI